MYMRYQWGLAIGHVYTWKDVPQGSSYYASLDAVITPDIAPVEDRSLAGNSVTPVEDNVQGESDQVPSTTRIGKIFVFEDGQGATSDEYAGEEDNNDSEADEEDNSDWEDDEIVVYDEMYDLDAM